MITVFGDVILLNVIHFYGHFIRFARIARTKVRIESKFRRKNEPKVNKIKYTQVSTYNKFKCERRATQLTEAKRHTTYSFSFF